MSETNRLRRATIVLVIGSLVSFITVNATPAPAAVPDPVLQWVGIMNDAVLAGGTSPLATTRVVALVTASMFDAVNGIRPHYQALYVQCHVPGHGRCVSTA